MTTPRARTGGHRAWITRAALFALLTLLGGCAALRPSAPRMPSWAITDAEQTTLGRVFTAQAAQATTQTATQTAQQPGLSGFQVVASGQTAFMARAALAQAAERTLDLQYYSVGDDLTTDLLLLHIVDAAERGVRVRILLDDIYAPTRLFAGRAMAAHPGIEVRLFNPFYFGGTLSLARLAEFIFDGARLNRRMHNKLWVTDNAAAIVGSRNLGDDYFDANESNNFSDVDLLAVGPIVADLSRAFDAYWNSAAAIPLAAVIDVPDTTNNTNDADAATASAAVRLALRARVAACQDAQPCRWLSEGGLLAALRSGSVALSWASAQFIVDLPGQDKPHLVTGIEHGSIDDHPGGDRTQSELLITSPYFVPSEDGLRHLGEMHERGVRVAVLTNSLASTDSPAAHAGYARHRAALLRAGVALYETRPQPGSPHDRSHRWGHVSPASLHAKVIVRDRVRAIVGSLNQDPRSRLHNTEAWLVIDSAEIAADLAALFEEGSDPQHAFAVKLSAGVGSDALEWKTEEQGLPVRYDSEPMTELWHRLWRGVLGLLIPEHLL